MPRTPPPPQQDPLTSESAHAMERLAHAALQLQQAAASPGASRFGSLLVDMGRGLQAVMTAGRAFGGTLSSNVRVVQATQTAWSDLTAQLDRAQRRASQLASALRTPAGGAGGPRVQAPSYGSAKVREALAADPPGGPGADAQDRQRRRLNAVRRGLTAARDRLDLARSPEGRRKLAREARALWLRSDEAGEERAELRTVAREQAKTPEGRRLLARATDRDRRDRLQDLIDRAEEARRRVELLRTPLGRASLFGEARTSRRAENDDLESSALARREAAREAATPEGRAESRREAAQDLARQADSLALLIERQRERNALLASPEGRAALEAEASLQRRAADELARETLLRRDAGRAQAATAEGALELDRHARQAREADLGALRDAADGEERKLRLMREAPEALAQELAARRRVADARRAQDALAGDAELAPLRTTDGDAQAREGLARRQASDTTELARAVELERQRAALLRSPEGRRALAEQARLRREAARAGAESRHAEIRGSYEGRLLGGLRGTLAADADALGGFFARAEAGMRGLGEAGQRAFAGIGAGVLGLAAVADPIATFPTLTASLEALGIQLGRAVLPLVDEFSGRLQAAAKWLKGLDDASRANAARVLVWAGAAGLAAAAAYKAVLALRALSVAMASNPMTLALTAALGVAAALSAEFLVMGDRASAAAKAVGGIALGGGGEGGGQKRAENAIAPEDLAAVPEAHRKAILGAGQDQAKVRAALQAFQAYAERQLEQARPRGLPGLAQRAREDERLARELGGEGGVYERAEAFAAKSEAALEAAREKDATWDQRYSRWVRGAFGADDRPIAEKLRESQMEEAQGLARDLARQAARDLARAGQPVLDESKMSPEEADRWRGRGVVMRGDLESRMLHGLLGLGKERPEDAALARRAGEEYEPSKVTDFRKMSQQVLGVHANADLLGLEASKKLAEDLLRKSGSGESPEMLRSFRWPAQPAIGDMESFSRQIQIDALKGGPLDKENEMERLINAVGALSGKADQIQRALEGIWEANRLPPFVGPRRD